jgi:hypothetical protein
VSPATLYRYIPLRDLRNTPTRLKLVIKAYTITVMRLWIVLLA